MDAITMLKQDHREVDALFARFEALGPRAMKTKRAIADRIIEMLSQHSMVEEMVFYPAARAEVERTEGTVLEALEEHHVVKWTLKELEDMSPEDDRFDAKMHVLISNVRHHVKEEERDLFPAVRKAIARKRLVEIGESMRTARMAAPTRPHPRAPDEPPGNIVAAAGAAVTDPAVRLVKAAKTRVMRS